MQQADIRLITGKGGVGKTVVSTALAMAAAQAGKKVLLCEIHGRDRVAQLLGVPPVGYRLREVLQNLWVVDINPRDALHEYVLLVLKFEALYRTLFENRLVRSFLDLVPALGELVMLGKVWFHAQEQLHDRRRFDLLVVDAPATGHAVALCRAPQVAFEAMPPGPMRDNAALLRNMLQNAAQTRLHVVTTPEDMPVTEALQLCQLLPEVGLTLGRIFINQRLPPLPAAASAALQAGVSSAAADPVAPPGAPGSLAARLEALRRREVWRQAGEVELLRLGDLRLQEALSLPRLETRCDARSLEVLAAELRAPLLRGEL